MTVTKHSYPPGPARGPLGNTLPHTLLALRRDTPGTLLKLARAHGDVVHLRFGKLNVYLLNHPAHIEKVLVTDTRPLTKGRSLRGSTAVLGQGLLSSEGSFHLRQRRLIQPIFHRQRIAGYGQTMAAYAARRGQRWTSGSTVDIAAEMMSLTLEIVGKTLFGSEVDAETGAVGAAMHTLLSLFRVMRGPFAGLIERFDLPPARRARAAAHRLDQIVYRLIAEHRAGRGGDDLLTMLLDAQDQEGEGAGMSDQQVRDEAMTLFLAGHETTANALTWTWHLLSQNPEVEARLHAELDSVLGERLPTAADLPQLPYTRRVFAEALRLYPPAWVMARQAAEDYRVGPYTVPAGSVMVFSQWVMHHDPRYYADAFRFDPDRWTPEAQAGRPRFAYFPFGAGPRVCIGEQFAWMEGMLIIATLARRWRLRPAPGHRAVLHPSITLRPRGRMPMVLQARG